MHPSEPFPHFVDDYLAYLHEVLPTQASLDGVHLHDDLLEDLSRPAIDAHVRALAGLRPPPASDRPGAPAANRAGRAPDRRREHRGADVRARGRCGPGSATRRSTPTLIGTSLAGQALFAYAPEPERARRVVSKLRQVPRLVQAARDNIKECPGIFVKIGLESWRGVLKFIETDLPRAFSSLDDLHILGDLADTSTEAAAAVASYIEYLETDLAPRAKASFRLGRENFEQKLKLDEGITLSADRLLAIALRELHEVQEEFRTRRRPVERRRSGRGVAAREGAASRARDARRGRAGAGQGARGVPAAAGDRARCPTAEPVVVAPSPEFYRWAFASMWTPGPVREQAEPRLLLPDRRRSRLAARAPEGAHARLQRPDAVEHLDSRGLSGPLPALPASAAGRVEGPQVHASSRRRRSSKAGRTTASR